jgi:hypothetical protein
VRISSDVNEEDIKYFMRKINKSQIVPEENEPIDAADLDIFNYNFEEQASPLDWYDTPSRKSNLASPRKLRTRSQDISGSESFTFFDDEFYDKYK